MTDSKPALRLKPLISSASVVAVVASVLTLALLAPPDAKAGKIYKWVDEQGRVHYAERKPPDAKASVMKTRKYRPSGSSAAAGAYGRKLDGWDGCETDLCKTVQESDPDCRTSDCQLAKTYSDGCTTWQCRHDRRLFKQRLWREGKPKRDAAANAHRDAERKRKVEEKQKAEEREKLALTQSLVDKCKRNRGVDCDSERTRNRLYTDETTEGGWQQYLERPGSSDGHTYLPQRQDKSFRRSTRPLGW